MSKYRYDTNSKILIFDLFLKDGQQKIGRRSGMDFFLSIHLYFGKLYINHRDIFLKLVKSLNKIRMVSIQPRYKNKNLKLKLPLYRDIIYCLSY
jgi:hypothetical protein